MEKEKNVKNVQGIITSGFSVLMSIIAIISFLVTGEEKIMYIVGFALCIMCICDFIIDIVFLIKRSGKV